MANKNVSRRFHNALLLVKLLRQMTPDAHVDIVVDFRYIKVKLLIERWALHIVNTHHVNSLLDR